MLEQRSAIAAVYQVGRFGAQDGPVAVTICERRARNLVQVSGWPDSFDAVCRELQAILKFPMPADGLKAESDGGRSVFRVGHERLWLTGPADDGIFGEIDETALGDQTVVTEIGQSRTVLRISGPDAQVALNRGLPVDLDDDVFPPDSFAQSVIHHIPVLIHRVDAAGEQVFDAYVTREYAVTFWELVVKAVEPLGGQVKEAG
jgi:sarcosine oxidase subunit gamma